MSFLLAFDTSGDACSVALLDAGRLLAQRVLDRETGFAGHSEHVLEVIDAVLGEVPGARDACQAIAFGAGPGAFTGLRVACAVAQGLGFGLDCPLVAVDCLAAMAWAAQHLHPLAAPSRLLVAQDARMGEVYASVFVPDLRGVMQCIDGPTLLRPEQIVQQWQGGLALLCGSASQSYPTLLGLAPVLEAVVRPEARAIGALGWASYLAGEAVDAALAAPLYVRDHVAQTIEERALAARTGP